MYEKYFEQLKEECLIRNRSSRTAETYISNITSFMKWTGNKPMEELCLQDGIFSCRSKKEKMDLCRKLLNSIQYLSQLRNKTVAEKLLILYQKDICKCEACGGKLSSFRLRGSYSLTG